MRLKELAYARPRYGYQRLTALLQRDGWPVNHKRVYHIFGEEGLPVRTKRRKKRAAQRRLKPMPPTVPRDRANTGSSAPSVTRWLMESFNGKLWDEFLNMHWFESIAEARRVIEQWRVEHNEMQPHSSPGNRAPAVYIAEVFGLAKDG